jgi:8-oxo-dGTP pyrophosphatase MutT (NUDIX family)
MQLQVGVKVIIKNRNGLYLFIKRSKILPGHNKHSWDIPGGRIYVEEHLIDALRRELHEELGVDLVGTPTLINAQDIFVPTKDLHVVRLTYLHNMEEGVITLSDEHLEYKWLSINDVLQLTVEPFLKETLDLIETVSE